MPDLLKPTKPTKLPKVKKTVEDLVGDGQLTTGKAFLEQVAQKIEQQEAFLVAAQEEERMRSQKGRRSR
jgi:polyhydroxyalkanoate synthesis regulator phasin